MNKYVYTKVNTKTKYGIFKYIANKVTRGIIQTDFSNFIQIHTSKSENRKIFSTIVDQI